MASPFAQAQPVPTEIEAFTKVAIERLQASMPGYVVSRVGPLTIEAKPEAGESTGSITLDRIHAYCLRNADRCREAVDDYASQVAKFIRERDQPIDKTMLRVAVRDTDYVANIRKLMGSGVVSVYTRPLAGPLVLVLMLDYPNSARNLNAKDLEKLGLTEDLAFQRGQQNLAAGTKPLADLATPAAGSFGSITGEYYASSRLALHDEWKVLAENLHGNLIVMVPTPDSVLYGDGSSPEGVEALRTFGRELAKRSSRQLSSVVFRWTTGGWEPL